MNKHRAIVAAVLLAATPLAYVGMTHKSASPSSAPVAATHPLSPSDLHARLQSAPILATNIPIPTPGASGSVLTSGGAGVTPSWNTPSITLAGDVTGASGSNKVSEISGNSPLPISTQNLQWLAGVSTPEFSQASTTGVSTQPMTLAPQASTNANGNGASLNVSLAGPTGSGSFGQLTVTNNGEVTFLADNQGVLLGRSDSGQQAMRIAPLIGQETTYTAIWAGADATSPNGGNFAIAFDGISSTLFNAGISSFAAGEIYLTTSYETFYAPTAGLPFTIGADPSIYVQAASDVDPGAVVIAGYNALPAAVTNLTGGNVVLAPGSGATTNGTPGSVIVALPNPTGSGSYPSLEVTQGGTTLFQLGADVSTPSFGGVYLGNVTPNGSNFTLLGNGTTDTYLGNVGGTGHLFNTVSGDSLIWTASGVAISNGGSTSFGGGVAVLAIAAATTNPSALASSGGGVTYEDHSNVTGLSHLSTVGTFETLGRVGAGTINSQAAQFFKYSEYGRVTGTTGTVTWTSPAIGSGQTLSVDVMVVCRVNAIGNGTGANYDAFSGRYFYAWTNNGGSHAASVGGGSSSPSVSVKDTTTFNSALTITQGSSSQSGTLALNVAGTGLGSTSVTDCTIGVQSIGN